jgi:hypothetical protein
MGILCNLRGCCGVASESSYVLTARTPVRVDKAFPTPRSQHLQVRSNCELPITLQPQRFIPRRYEAQSKPLVEKHKDSVNMTCY